MFKVNARKNQLRPYQKLFIGFLMIYLIRLLIVFNMGITPQDAYYHLYSEHLALSYFDHPPMVAYMLRVFGLVLGQNVIGIKLTDFIVTLASLFAFYRLARFFLSEARAFKASLFYGTTLMLSVLSINTTPDVPLMLFWTLALIFVFKALFENELWHWALAGFLIGLAFDSKYTGGFLLLGLFAFLLLSKSHRPYLFSKQSLLLLVFFGIAVFPVVYWNYSNDWISFTFQTSQRAESVETFRLQPLIFLGSLGTQLLLLVPFLFVGMVVVMWKMLLKTIKEKRLPGDKTLFLMAFSIPMILFFFSLSFFYWIKLNWSMPAYISAIILVSAFLGQGVLKGQVLTSLVLHVVLAVQIIFYPVNVESDDTWYGWEELATRVDGLMEEHPNAFLFSDDHYKTSAVLSYYLDRKVYAGNVTGGNGQQFYILDPDLSYLNGSSAIFIDSEPRFNHHEKSGGIPDARKRYFDRVEELDPILIGPSENEPLRKFHVYKCDGYNSGGKKD